MGGLESFIDYAFKSRKDTIKRMIQGELRERDIFLEFTRATPVVITDGPAGLSGSVKMLGFIPKENLIDRVLKELRRILERKRSSGISLASVMDIIYNENVIDFNKLGGLEMGFNHSWKNIRSNGRATLLFYTPPVTSYEVRCSVKIHESGPLHKYLNLLHNLFHVVDRQRKSYPAYEFIIEEIYDQSATENGFGRLIYKRESEIS